MMDLGHAVIEIVGTAATTTTTLGLYMWNNKRQAKEEAKKRQEELNSNAEARQEEIRLALNGMATERKYYPAHKHKENSGPLTAECIEYPPKGDGK